MSRIRVLVVDDSSTMRQLVTRALAGDPLIEVAGSAGSAGKARTSPSHRPSPRWCVPMTSKVSSARHTMCSRPGRGRCTFSSRMRVPMGSNCSAGPPGW